jgi:hypothetical protein
MLAESSDADLWQQGLRQQVFLGDEEFVGRMLGEQAARHGSPTRVDGIPRRQTRRPASLDRLLAQHGDRDEAIVQACRDGGFTRSAIARQLGLSVSRVSRVISMAEARGKTWPLPPSSRAATTMPTAWACLTAWSLNSAVYSCFGIFFTSLPSGLDANHRPLEDEKRLAAQPL